MSKHTKEGLAQVYFPNGGSFDLFNDRCAQCRHWREEPDEHPRPPRTTVPGNICDWAVYDRIVAALAKEKHAAYSYHPPEDIDGSTCPPTCLRFTRKADGDGEARDPPRPDVPGQMMLGEALEPVRQMPEPHHA